MPRVALLNILDQVATQIIVAGKLKTGELFKQIDKRLSAVADPAVKPLIAAVRALIEAHPQAQTPEAIEHFTRDLDALRETIRREAATAEIAPPAETEMVTPAPAAQRLEYDRDNPDEIIASFHAEASAHLQDVERCLMLLERQPIDSEAHTTAMGALHSLKGICGYLGVETMRDLVHRTESALHQARRESGVSRAECELFLRVTDTLREMTARILRHRANLSAPFPLVPAEYTAQLQSLTAASAGASSSRAAALTDAASSPAASASLAFNSVTGPSEPPVVEAQFESKPERSPLAAAEDSANGAADGGSIARLEASLVRVRVEKLDALIDLLGEMVVMQSQVQQDPDVKALPNPRLIRNLSQLNKITRELQEVGTSLRMHPLHETFQRMTRIVRDLAARQGKTIEVRLTGADTELDKKMLEALVDPLTHLVRNAVDHGIGLPAERAAQGKPATAILSLSARHHSGRVVLTITDDGTGLNLQRIRAKARERGLLPQEAQISDAQAAHLIFEPGFSTAEQVTDISGRGVGLDVVRRNISALGGKVSVSHRAGEFTTFEIQLPLTLAIIDGMIAQVGPERLIVPITSVVELIRPHPQQVKTVRGRGEMIRVRGEHLPLIRVAEYMNLAPEAAKGEQGIVVIVDCDGERCGLFVDRLLGQQQVVIKPLSRRFGRARGVAGGAVLGDGRVGLILEVAEILAASRHNSFATWEGATETVGA